MTTAKTPMTCPDARPLLFALLEGEVAEAERTALTVHLARCEACRHELEREASLSRALGSANLAVPRQPSPRRELWAWRAAAAVLVGTGLVTLAVTFGGRTALGSIAPERFEPTLRLESGEVRALETHNHLEVPASERDVIELLGTGTLAVVGPAVLELDRTPDAWKLVLLRGQVRATIQQGSRLLVSSVHGATTLLAGTHLVTLEAASLERRDGETTPGELLQAGYAQFFQLADMAKAEASFRAALDHPKATAEEKNRALFYLSAAVARQERFEDALELQSRWLELYPDDQSVDYVLLFQGIYLRTLGREEEARAQWQEILRRSPDSEMAEHARGQLGMPAGTTNSPRSSQGSSSDRYVPERLLPATDGATGPDVVVALGLGQDEFRRVAEEAAKACGTRLLECAVKGGQDAKAAKDAKDAKDQGFDLEALETELRALRPGSVLFVVRPQDLDVRLHRQVLLLSAKLDEDVFPDFAFGWFTARDGAGIEALWKRTRETRRKGLASKRWTSTFVTTGMKSCEYPEYGLDVAKSAGFEQRAFAFATVESDPECRDFVKKSLPELSEAAVVTMTGNGDPQGIWLFDDGRNADAARHWPFDPMKVGHDPEGEMPRILARQFAALKLDRPVVWSGTCHSAATHRVFVESDIVATFGRCDEGNTGLYEMPLEESLGLALVQAGAVALLAPIGANHGYSVDLEGEFALTEGASLGETVKSTWDDVFLQARGELVLALPERGAPPGYASEHIMQGGGANRALLGDPTLRPFERTPQPRERTSVRNAREKSFDVVVEWDRGQHVRSWNLYAADMRMNRRIAARIALDDVLPSKEAVLVSAKLRVVARDGKSGAQTELPGFVLTHAEPEVFRGRRFLHLQASAPEKTLEDQDVRAIFTVTWKPAGES